ncbi:MazG nucleotide pyrophosphohydrolase domain-containing protein [Candidatus Harpocratesius sp.]
MDIEEFQKLMKDLYFHFDSQRGLHRTALWLGEEIGELMAELKKAPKFINKLAVAEELADILAWSASLANLLDISLDQAVFKKYPGYCLKCGKNPCQCHKNLSSL